MPPFPHRLPKTLALGSRPCPGPGGARCTGAQRLPEIQILGRLMPLFSHARQACQVCQCPQSPRWPSTTSCSWCREMPMPARLQSSRHGGGSCGARGDLKELDNLGINLETSLAAIALAPLPVDSVVTVLRAPMETLNSPSKAGSRKPPPPLSPFWSNFVLSLNDCLW